MIGKTTKQPQVVTIKEYVVSEKLGEVREK